MVRQSLSRCSLDDEDDADGDEADEGDEADDEDEVDDGDEADDGNEEPVFHCSLDDEGEASVQVLAQRWRQSR